MFLISEQQSEEVNLITEKNANGGKDTFIEGVFLQHEKQKWSSLPHEYHGKRGKSI